MSTRPWINHPDYYERVLEWVEWGWFRSRDEKERMQEPKRYRLHIVDEAVAEWSEREPLLWCRGSG